MDKISTGTAYATAGFATVFGFTVNEFVAFAGIAIALATFLGNLVFKYLHYKLEKGKTDARSKSPDR